MATFDRGNFDDLAVFMDQLANMPDHILDDALNAGADILVDQIKKNARTVLAGPYNKGGVAGGVKKKRPTKSGGGRKIPITFEGTQHGERIGTIAFVNEFGTKKQKARPFVKQAIEETKESVTRAEEEVINNYIQSI